MKKSILFGALALFAISAMSIQNVNAQNEVKSKSNKVGAESVKSETPSTTKVAQEPVKQKTAECCESQKASCDKKKGHDCCAEKKTDQKEAKDVEKQMKKEMKTADKELKKDVKESDKQLKKEGKKELNKADAVKVDSKKEDGIKK